MLNKEKSQCFRQFQLQLGAMGWFLNHRQPFAPQQWEFLAQREEAGNPYFICSHLRHDNNGEIQPVPGIPEESEFI